jgi:hypothetical protein
MAYTNDFVTGYAGGYNVGKVILDEVVTLTRYHACATTNLGSGEYSKMFTIPANFAILEAYVVTTTVEGAGDTMDVTVNDATTHTLVNNADMNTEGCVTATNARIMHTTETYVCVKPDNALTACAFVLIIRGILLSTAM